MQSAVSSHDDLLTDSPGRQSVKTAPSSRAPLDGDSAADLIGGRTKGLLSQASLASSPIDPATAPGYSPVGPPGKEQLIQARDILEMGLHYVSYAREVVAMSDGKSVADVGWVKVRRSGGRT